MLMYKAFLSSGKKDHSSHSPGPQPSALALLRLPASKLGICTAGIIRGQLAN